ncbi:MAG: tripartite tricarboxylate transporter substrate-binding protein [Betaproteobacteria bacterium]|nr:tripartite tricarboxylate transporter substrate-binding protein [Betaproteobacteria bacterium]MDH3435788.1 tripartite tricarboxylate transporter substrate-binding protein [Betaproteobacteria bacterium]
MNAKIPHRAVTALAAAAAAFAIAAPSVFAAGVDFAGKKVTIIVPFKEGGGADVYARLFQPYLAKYLPGNPTVIVRNQPGGGSVKGANKFQQSKPDGLTAMACSTSTLVPFALGNNKVKYDVLSWRPVILSPRGAIFYVNPKTGAKGKDIVADIRALRKAKLTYGAKNPTSSELRGLLGFQMLGMNDVNTVFGLSSGEQRKAFLRGEININYDTAGSYSRKVAKFEEQGKVVPVFTMGYGAADGSIKRDPAYPEMATITEAYEKVNGKPPSGPSAAAYLAFLHMGVTASKSLVLPKGTPDEIVDVWVSTAKKVVADPQFRKTAKKVIGAYDQSYGADAANVLKTATGIDPNTKAWLKGWIKERFNHDM